MKATRKITTLCALLICAVFNVCAQSSLETDLVKAGNQPIKEVHYIWKLDFANNKIEKQVNALHHRPGGSIQNKEYHIVKPLPKDSLEGYTVYAYECKTKEDSTNVELTLCFPKKETDILMITEEVEIKSSFPRKLVYRTIFSTTPMSPEEKLEYAAYRAFIDKIAAEGGDTIRAKNIWKQIRNSQ